MPMIQERKACGLVVTPAARVDALPDGPSTAEFNLKNVDIPAWSGLWVHPVCVAGLGACHPR